MNHDLTAEELLEVEVMHADALRLQGIERRLGEVWFHKDLQHLPDHE
jgi:hypothetical protein